MTAVGPVGFHRTAGQGFDSSVSARVKDRGDQMAKYNLQPNEVVVLTESRVCHGGLLSLYTDELMLTSHNLVLVKKGVFGNGKGVLTFPISQIKVWEGRAHAITGRAHNGTPLLEVFFVNGQEKFSFQSGGKRKITAWINRINDVVTGTTSPAPQAGAALPGAEAVAGALADTFKVFKGKFGSGAQAPTQVSGKCRSCGAPVSGLRGQPATCGYCGTAQQL